MIYKFRLISSNEEDFICDIELNDDNTFLDFHKIIQKTLKYDNSMLASFYLCNDNWEKEQEISLMNMESELEDEIPMKEAVLKDYMYKKHDRIIYVYDMFTESALYIELLSVLKENSGSKYPLCSNISGKIPPQSNIANDSPEL